MQCGKLLKKDGPKKNHEIGKSREDGFRQILGRVEKMDTDKSLSM